MTVTPTFGVRPVAALSLQFWSEVHSFVFAVLADEFHMCDSSFAPAQLWIGGPHMQCTDGMYNCMVHPVCLECRGRKWQHTQSWLAWPRSHAVLRHST